MRSRKLSGWRAVQAVILFLAISLLAGGLTAGLALPFAGLAGETTERVHSTVQFLPQDLETAPLAQKSQILAADGSLIATLYEENRTPVTLRQISPVMRQAIVAIEDSRYYEHGALDLRGTLRALLTNQAGGSVQQGGSSITQQYVKLSLVAKARTLEERQAATAETYERKIAELRYAIAVEKQFTKTQILEKYLNLAFFGSRSYGVEAAALHYFGVHASRLNLPQAALLAGLVKSPNAYDPIQHPKAAKARRDVVLRRMAELKVITDKQARDAIKTPVIDPRKVRKVPNGCANSKYPHYCDYILAQLKANKLFGKDEEAREKSIETAGLTIRTSLDPKMQAAAQKAMDKHTKLGDEAVAALTLVEPGSGLVKAMVQSRPHGSKKGYTSYNYNVEKSYPGGFGGFQNGSTMKTFTIAAAIKQAIPLTYRINSPQRLPLSGVKFNTCSGTTSDDDYTPKNSTTTIGDPSMIQAAQASTNTYFLQLSKVTGLCPIAKLAGAMGMKDGQTGEPLDQVVSFTLGSAGLITPLALANAYATFAARGVYCAPRVITGVTTAQGKAVAMPGKSCKRVLPAAVADGVNHVLGKVMEQGGTGAKMKFGKSDLAGKTGTTDSNKAVWFAGYSSRLAAASVVADADAPATNLIDQRFNGKDLDDASGSGTAGPIWKMAMQGALKGLPSTRFVPATDKTIRGDVKDLPDLKGLPPEEAMNKLRELGFKPELASTQVDSDAQAGTVAWTSPRQEDGAPAGSPVTIYLSNGSKATPPTTPPTPPTTGHPPVPPTIGPTKPVPPTTGIPSNCPPWHPQFPKCNRPRR